MLKINNLRKNFGEKTAVDIDNFTVNNGDILGLVGNNGAGKTTLFRLILDLLKDSLYSHATANALQRYNATTPSSATTNCKKRTKTSGLPIAAAFSLPPF